MCLRKASSRGSGSTPRQVSLIHLKNWSPVFLFIELLTKAIPLPSVRSIWRSMPLRRRCWGRSLLILLSGNYRQYKTRMWNWGILRGEITRDQCTFNSITFIKTNAKYISIKWAVCRLREVIVKNRVQHKNGCKGIWLPTIPETVAMIIKSTISYLWVR